MTKADLTRDHDTLIELLEGLDLAVRNARDLDTLRSLIGDATERALLVQRGTQLPPRVRSL